MAAQKILVTGATGYVGGRLVPCLLEAGYEVRCFARNPKRLQGRAWSDAVEIVQGDALDYDSVLRAMDGIDVAYYLIHSLAAGKGDFEDLDRRAANNFGQACQEQGVARIIYLGGMKPSGEHVSEHLRSRLETGDMLREWNVPVTEFRAAVVVGSGSLSFELIRYLTERVPLMLCPRWVQTPTQPIAVRNVLQYLVRAISVPESTGETIQIGGTDVLSYAEMFKIYAKVRGLRRPVINLPFLTPTLSAGWVGLITPVNTDIARILIEGLDNKVVVTDDKADRLFDVRKISYEAAVRLALRRFADQNVETTWHDARSSSDTLQQHRPTEVLKDTEGLIQEQRQLHIPAQPGAVFNVVTGLGGDTGWLFANLLWQIRGFADLLIGGFGLRRGRRHPRELRVGDALDFWRVEALEENHLLRLRAEMKVPGKAWLQFELEPTDEGTFVTQTALFEPKGLFGLVYWYLFYLPHKVLFPGMLREIGRNAEAIDAVARPEPVTAE